MSASIYYDDTDDLMDGHGWNVVETDDDGGIAARFRTKGEAEAYVSARTMRNIYWRDALRSEAPVIRQLRTWTCGNATVFWHGQESREAQTALRKAEISKEDP